jgi:hypothetical protein
VRDGPRGDPDGFHLLRLAYLCLEHLAAADVARVDDADAAAGAVGLEPAHRLERPPLPVDVAQPVLDRRGCRVVLAAFVECEAHPRNVVGVDELEQVPPDQILWPVTEVLLGRRALVDDGAELVDDRDDVERAFGERPVEAVMPGR